MIFVFVRTIHLFMSRRKDKVAELRAKRLGNLASVSNDTPEQPSPSDTRTTLDTIAQQIENRSQTANETVTPSTISQRYREDLDPFLQRLERDTTKKLAEYVQEKHLYVNDNK